jgi:hypothetical protein
VQQPASYVIPECTLVYPHLFQPRVMKDSANPTPKYQTAVLIPLTLDMAGLHKLALEAAVRLFGSDAQRLIQAGVIKSPFRKQMEKAALGQMGYSSDPSAVYINVASEQPPGVVDYNLNPILDPSKVYGGVVANVQINAFAWNHATGGKGISFGLQNVQILRDGPKLGSGNPDPRSVFTAVEAVEGETIDANVRALFS